MQELSPRGFASFIAAALGGFSWFALPWTAATLTIGTSWRTAGLSGGHLIYLLFTPPGPELEGWQALAGSSFSLLVFGSFLYLMGCLLVAVQVFTRWPWFGLVMMTGALVCSAAIGSFTGRYSVQGGYTLIVGPSVGLYFGIIAALVSLAPLFIWKGEAEWRSAEQSGEKLANDFWRDRAILELTPGMAVVATGVQPRETRSSCPKCGRGYYTEARVCVLDGTPLRSTRAEDAPPDVPLATAMARK